MNIVIIANPWGAAADNPTSKHQVACALRRGGHRVVWVEGAGMRVPNWRSPADWAKVLRKVRQAAGRRAASAPLPDEPDVVLSPLLAPFPSSRLVRRVNARRVVGGALEACRRMGLARPVLLNFVPTFAEAMAEWKARGLPAFYYCVDRWDAFECYDAGLMRDLDAQCCRHADGVFASSSDLLDRCRAWNPNSHLVPHGVDVVHFSRALRLRAEGAGRPPDVPPGTVVGFVGLLSEWVDADLLLAVADRVRDAQLVLIGKADVDVRRLAAHPRIRMLGPRLYRTLPEYLACFKAGLIPFKVNDLTRAVNPIKLREMLAAGCPVISTALPEVRALAETAGSGVEVAETREDFIGAVERLVRQPDAPGRGAEISRTVERDSWESRVELLLARMEAVRPGRSEAT